MSGVTILSSEMAMTINPIGGIVFLVGLLLTWGILATWRNGSFYSNLRKYLYTSGIISGMILLIFGSGWLLLFPEEDHIEYKVVVSEDVSLQEFLDKYEIVSRDGEIFIVKDVE